MSSGLVNSLVCGVNADFHSLTAFGASINNGLRTNGQLWIGTTTPNAGGTTINVGTLTSPNGSIAIGYSSPNITLETVAGDDLHVARYIVSAGGATDGANYTTIASAYAAAVAVGAPQTVFIQPGTYTENIALTAGINLCAFDCDALTPNVIINGKITFSSAGTVSISGIQLQTNSDYCLAVTGSAASIVNLTNCYINALNHTAIDYTSSSASSKINFTVTNGNIATTGITYFTSSSAGALSFSYCTLNDTGNSSTASTISAGQAVFTGCELFFPMSASAGILVYNFSGINTIGTNTTSVTTSGSGTASFHQASTIASGTASAISVGSGTTVNCYDTIQINSSNTHALTGSGAINYGIIVYTGTSSLNNITTQNAYPTQPPFVSGSPTYFQAYLSSPQTIDVSFFTTIVYNSTTANVGSGYNTATGVFTAPATGFYSFQTTSCVVMNVTGAQTDILVCSTGSVQSARQTQLASAAADTGTIIFTFAWSLPMTAGDTMEVQAFANGTGTFNMDGTAISSGVATTISTFSGYRVA